MLDRMSEAELTRKGERIFQAALSAVEPETLVKRKLTRRGHYLFIGEKKFDLRKIKHIRAAAIGKAAPAMASALADVLGSRLEEGIFLYLPQENIRVFRFKGMPAPHPLPDAKSREASREILRLAGKSKDGDLLILCISGGGSAQLSYPVPGMTMEAKRGLIDGLLRAGADIRELNTVRKHLSLVKGGRLAQAAFPAAMVNLVISDVIGNKKDTIASGPGWGDRTTFQDSRKILNKYRLWDNAPDSVKEIINEGIQGKRPETPAPDDPVFQDAAYIIAGDNRTALRAARKESEKLGLVSKVVTSADSGEARSKASDYIRVFMAAKKEFSRSFCLITGGEMTVTVKGTGKGGRNQEFVLAFLMEMNRLHPEEKNWAVFSLGTDGIDGPTSAAGAGGGPSVIERAFSLNLKPRDYLDNNDSFSFFTQAGGLIQTGPTRTNVMDIRLFLHG